MSLIINITRDLLLFFLNAIYLYLVIQICGMFQRSFKINFQNAYAFVLFVRSHKYFTTIQHRIVLKRKYFRGKCKKKGEKKSLLRVNAEETRASAIILMFPKPSLETLFLIWCILFFPGLFVLSTSVLGNYLIYLTSFISLDY